MPNPSVWEHSKQSSPRPTVTRSSSVFRRRSRWPNHRPQPAPHDAGFVLLFAFFGALMLLLSSLSIQTAALQSRASEFALRRRAQREDALSSAAQIVAGQLQRYPCLLPLWMAEWEGPEASCITWETATALQSGTLPGGDAAAGRYRVLSYAPVRQASVDLTLVAAELELQWQPARGPRSQRRYQLSLLPGPRLGGIQP